VATRNVQNAQPLSDDSHSVNSHPIITISASFSSPESPLSNAGKYVAIAVGEGRQKRGQTRADHRCSGTRKISQNLKVPRQGETKSLITPRKIVGITRNENWEPSITCSIRNRGPGNFPALPWWGKSVISMKIYINYQDKRSPQITTEITSEITTPIHKLQMLIECQPIVQSQFQG
jgi:hypothetical protein